MNGEAGAMACEIGVRGRVDEAWFDWLGGVTMTFEPEPRGPGLSILTGSLDQSALRGLLCHLWDLNLTVVSVTTRDSSAAPEPACRSGHKRARRDVVRNQPAVQPMAPAPRPG